MRRQSSRQLEKAVHAIVDPCPVARPRDGPSREGGKLEQALRIRGVGANGQRLDEPPETLRRAYALRADALAPAEEDPAAEGQLGRRGRQRHAPAGPRPDDAESDADAEPLGRLLP